jgi:hypothetical protein
LPPKTRRARVGSVEPERVRSAHWDEERRSVRARISHDTRLSPSSSSPRRACRTARPPRSRARAPGPSGGPPARRRSAPRPRRRRRCCCSRQGREQEGAPCPPPPCPPSFFFCVVGLFPYGGMLGRPFVVVGVCVVVLWACCRSRGEAEEEGVGDGGTSARAREPAAAARAHRLSQRALRSSIDDATQTHPHPEHRARANTRTRTRPTLDTEHPTFRRTSARSRTPPFPLALLLPRPPQPTAPPRAHKAIGACRASSAHQLTARRR